MKPRFGSILSAFAMFLGLSSFAFTPKAQYRPNKIEAAIDTAISEKRLVGAVVMIALEGHIIYQRAAGFADREALRPMRDDTIFRLASVTKPIVTAVAMQLVEKGRLKLDDPVTRWLPDFRPRLFDGTIPTITISHLLNHTSGLSYRFQEAPNSGYSQLNVSDGMDQPGLSLEENLRRLSQTTLVFTPGKEWRYSLATDVLGAVIEKASGKKLQDVVAEGVTGPLGMTDTGFGVGDVTRLAVPYYDHKPEPKRMETEADASLIEVPVRFAPERALNPDSYPSGGAGMSGTARDIFHFLEVIRTGGKPILSSTSISKMTTDSVGLNGATQGPGWGFGYGWAVLIDRKVANTPQSNGTIQWGGAYGHSWFVDPSRKLTVVALTNTAFEGMNGQFPMDLRDAIYADLDMSMGAPDGDPR